MWTFLCCVVLSLESFVLCQNYSPPAAYVPTIINPMLDSQYCMPPYLLGRGRNAAHYGLVMANHSPPHTHTLHTHQHKKTRLWDPTVWWCLSSRVETSAGSTRTPHMWLKIRPPTAHCRPLSRPSNRPTKQPSTSNTLLQLHTSKNRKETLSEEKEVKRKYKNEIGRAYASVLISLFFFSLSHWAWLHEVEVNREMELVLVPPVYGVCLVRVGLEPFEALRAEAFLELGLLLFGESQIIRIELHKVIREPVARQVR